LEFNTLRFIYIAFISFLFSSSLWSQKTFASRALDYSWIYSYSSWGNIVSKNIFQIDTSILHFNGKKYYTLDQFKVADSGTKVFCLVSSTEVLVMDYAYKEADTILMNRGSKIFKMKVLTKRKVEVENDSLWYIVLKPLDYPYGFSNIEWIESIGCISHGYHPINWLSNLGVYDVGYRLHCVTNNDTSILRQFGKNCALDNTLINPNKKWYTWVSGDNGDNKTSQVYQFTNNDTIIAGRTYKIMNVQNRFVRYDGLSGKYYIVSNKLGEEMMVFNDKAKIGDTIYSTMSWTDKVTHITYQWLQDEYRKVYTTNKDKYISGIGWENRVMWDNHLITFPEYQAGNICYGEFASIKYHYPFYYQNREQCEITSSIQNANQEALHIFPNPVKNLLNISSADKKEFRILNSYGALVLEGECEGTIDVAGLMRGIYFLNIHTRDKALYTKFLKD
jgi:hypothetical protein